jgi:hypothetical protein
VVLVFDVSGSMEKHDMLSRGREAAIRLIRSGLKPGDTWVVYAFDTETQKTTERVVPRDGVEAAVQSVPGDLSRKPGTNIRWAHHEALRWVEERRPRKSFLILVSDSYNDPPAAEDPARGQYSAYYLPNSLTKYPDTPQNREYERLLRQREALGITTWGIGVGIDRQTGRPIERYLAEPAPSSQLPAPSSDLGVSEPGAGPAGAGTPRAPGAALWLLLALVGVAAGAVLWSRASQAMSVSLAEGARSFRNYRLRPRAAISLGGAGAAEYDLGYPIAGTTHPVATLRRAGKVFRLEPAARAADGVVVALNGEVLMEPVDVVFGDEIRVRLPAASTPGAPNAGGSGVGAPPAPPREVRLEFGRAREET